jgi:hypothetical protein
MMKKLSLAALAATTILVLACKRDGGDATGAASSAATTSTPTLAQKALTFLTGGVFEGTVTADMTTAGKGKRSVTWEFKGDKLRYDLAGEGPVQNGWILFDGSSKKMYMVNDPQKSVMVIDTTQGAPGAAAAAAKVTKSGKHETIAGYDCEDWTIETATGKTETCVSEGLAFNFGSPRDPATDWAKALADEKRFPLRSVTYDAAGTEQVRLEVTKIERKAEDAARFEVPAGYRQMDLGALLGGMARPR